MSLETATPETGPVDAPVSMDSIIAEIETGNTPSDAADEAVDELVEQADGGDADAPDDSEGKTEPAEVETEETEEGNPEEAETETEEPCYTVKVNGVEQEVSLSELRNGYSRNEDYKAKTMALSEERKGLEAKLSADYSNQLQQATELFTKLDPILAEASQIDWPTLAQQDPTTYTQLKAAVEARQEAVGRAQAEIQRVQQAQEQQRLTELNDGIKATEAAIRASDPALADDAKFADYVKTTVGALGSVGLDSDDLQKVLASPEAGPAVLSLVHDAMRFRAQQKARETLPQKKVVPVSQAKPLKADATDGSKTPRRLPKSANTDDRAAFVVKELMEGF